METEDYTTTNHTNQIATFKSRVERYYKQLTDGCGRKNCDNFICFSNPALKKYKLLPNEAGIMAIQLARDKKFLSMLCSTEQTPDDVLYLDMEILCDLVEKSILNDDYKPLMDHLDKVLSFGDFLGYSFLKSPKQIILDGKDTGLDLAAVAKFYDIMNKMPEQVQNTVAQAFDRLTDNFQVEEKDLNNKALLRKLMFLIESPKILDDSYKKIIITTFTFATSLPQQLQDFLKENYVSSWSDDKFLYYNQILQDFIALRILTSPPRNILNNDVGVTSVTKFIGWLWDINKKRNLLTTSEFYNQVVNDYLILKFEYPNWTKKKSQRFAFCNYPYILNPETKGKIMNWEAEDTMSKRQREILFMEGTIHIPVCYLKVRRDHLIEDSVDTLTVIKMEDPTHLKKPLKIAFVGEQGIDEGGVKKEWFQLVVEDLFNVKYGMFLANNESRTYWFNQASQDFNEYELLGTVVGLAIYNSVILDLQFPLLVYKKLCGLKLNLDDLKEVNPSLCNGLKHLLNFEGNAEDLELRFEISYESYGASTLHELKPDGANIVVTKENKEEYVKLYVDYLLERSITLQFDAFKKGFDSVCAGPALKLFEPEELQQLICGSPVLDFDELEKSTTYDNGYSPDHPTIKQFWDIVRDFSIEEKKKLLFFTTGSDRCPIGGLKNLNLVITRNGGDTPRLPTSHTCFNHLLLPEYDSKKKLEELLKKAITHSTGFGMM